MNNIGNIFYFQWELDFLHWIQKIHNPLLDKIMPKITQLGYHCWFWVVLIVVLLILPFNRKMGLQAAISLLLTYLFCKHILKPEIMRCRPCWLEPDIPMLIKSPKDYSFPSGHSNAAFAVAVAIFSRSKRLGIPVLILASLIAFSRMYLFVHWPTDIIGGIVTGTIGAVISYNLVEFTCKLIIKLRKNCEK